MRVDNLCRSLLSECACKIMEMVKDDGYIRDQGAAKVGETWSQESQFEAEWSYLDAVWTVEKRAHHKRKSRKRPTKARRTDFALEHKIYFADFSAALNNEGVKFWSI